MSNFELLDPLILEDIENPNHPSEYISVDGYEVLILRLPEVTAEKVEITSYPFLFQDEKLYLFERDSAAFRELGSAENLVFYLDEKIDKLLKEIQRYHFDIDMLEESLYGEKISDTFMQEWLQYKKDLSLIYRVMFHASLAYELYLTKLKQKSSLDTLPFSDIAEHIGRIRDLSKAALEKLDNLYDFYRAKVDERMNKNVYYLTVISGIFLPLTLITGFFGMNTGGLPWMEDPNGTTKAIVVAFVLEFLMIIPFAMLGSGKIKRFRRKR